MQKKKTFSEIEKEVLRSQKMEWRMWEPLQQLPNSIIIKHKVTGEVKVIDRVHIPS